MPCSRISAYHLVPKSSASGSGVDILPPLPLGDEEGFFSHLAPLWESFRRSNLMFLEDQQTCLEKHLVDEKVKSSQREGLLTLAQMAREN